MQSVLARPLVRPLARPLDHRQTPLFYLGNTHPGLVSVSRPSLVNYWSGSTYQAFAADQPVSVGGVLAVQPASTELMTHSTEPLEWGDVGSTSTPTGNANVLGLFTPVRVASGGETWHGLYKAISLTIDEALSLVFIYKAGTSGNVFLLAQNDANNSIITGVVGFASVVAEDAGSLSLVEEEIAPDIFRARMLLTANTTGTYNIGICPNSATAGEDLIVYGGSIRKQTVFDNDWIVTGDASATRAADVLTFTPPEAQDITLYGTAHDGTDYMSTPLVVEDQSTEWTIPDGEWSSITARAST